MLPAMSFSPRNLAPLSVLFLTCSSLVACGGGKKPAEDAPKVEIDNEDEFDEGMEMMQEVGGMNEEKVTSTFKRLQPDLVDCLMTAGKGQDYLFGDVAFVVTVDRSGKAVAAHTERSTLGNYQAERCMLDVLTSSTWPKPVGGLIGYARNGMGYDAPEDIRPPVDWSSAEIDETLADEKNRASLSACGSGGPYELTAYVAPSGKVLSVGVAHTVENGEEKAACLVTAVEEVRFKSPGSWRAKVTFRL